ncbi:hypothetical protein K788_0004463 [Paraburkholderia caribensis MBA4]|uniref:Uncharacterized protein n=1 Tax=Paraburkholderia caribensis MBA4 TaxID=1323664 RepID=A0A0P0R9Z7_9BURK|nr:hypothetical protein K788_0004463 [Paraburkholderia caribensis MBA4]
MSRSGDSSAGSRSKRCVHGFGEQSILTLAEASKYYIGFTRTTFPCPS